jgi:hypothetical protein
MESVDRFYPLDMVLSTQKHVFFIFFLRFFPLVIQYVMAIFLVITEPNFREKPWLIFVSPVFILWITCELSVVIFCGPKTPASAPHFYLFEAAAGSRKGQKTPGLTS